MCVKEMTALCKKGFSPRNLKKGAAVVVLVAVAAGAEGDLEKDAF